MGSALVLLNVWEIGKKRAVNDYERENKSITYNNIIVVYTCVYVSIMCDKNDQIKKPY